MLRSEATKHLIMKDAHFASYTVFPPTTVRSTFVFRISSGFTFVMSRSSTTKSANIPGAKVPFSFSANSA